MRRILAVMLICMLLLSLLSVAALAAGVDSPEGQVEIVTDPTVSSPQTGMNGELLAAAAVMVVCLCAAFVAFRKAAFR